MVELQVSTRHTGTRRVVKVRVHDSLKEMRAAALRHSRWAKVADGNQDAYGVTHMFWYKEQPRIIIQLVRGHLGAELVSHESTHAAIHLYLSDIGEDMQGIEKEEILCYLVGDIFSKLNQKFYDRNLYEVLS